MTAQQPTIWQGAKAWMMGQYNKKQSHHAMGLLFSLLVGTTMIRSESHEKAARTQQG